MKLQTLVFLLAAPFSLCQGTSSGSDLLTVLQSDPNTKGFGDLLEEFPDLVTSLDDTKQYTVFAPSNEAVAAFRATLNSSGAIIGRSHRLNRRSIPSYAASIALLFTDRSNQVNLNTQPTDLITNLTDPDYINVSPASNSASLTQSSSSSPSTASSTSSSAQPTSSSTSSTASSTQSTLSSVSSTSSSVQPTTSSAQSTTSSTQSTLTTASTIQSPTSTSSSSPPPPPPPPPPPNAGCPSLPKRKTIQSRSFSSSHSRRQLSNSTLSVYSGFGDTASASLSETPYSLGAVRTVDSFFTLFGDLPSTLAKTNGTAFSAALSQANTLSSLSNTPRITVFVPTDAALQGQTLDADTLKRYILFDTLATTTSLAGGNLTSSSGENVNVTVLADGSYTVNNVNLIGENVMIKNGVIHYIDNVFPALTYTSAAPVVKHPVLPAVAAVIAILVSYVGMASF